MRAWLDAGDEEVLGDGRHPGICFSIFSYLCSKTMSFTNTSGTNQAATNLMHRATCWRQGPEGKGKDRGEGRGERLRTPPPPATNLKEDEEAQPAGQQHPELLRQAVVLGTAVVPVPGWAEA